MTPRTDLTPVKGLCAVTNQHTRPVTNMSAVDKEIAVQIASDAVENVSADQARAIIAKYVEMMARCPVCGGTGQIEFPEDAAVNTPDSRPAMIHAGSKTRCPRCPPLIPGMPDGIGDRENVAWVCRVGQNPIACTSSSPKLEHVDCGWHVVIPLP